MNKVLFFRLMSTSEEGSRRVYPKCIGIVDDRQAAVDLCVENPMLLCLNCNKLVDFEASLRVVAMAKEIEDSCNVSTLIALIISRVLSQG